KNVVREFPRGEMISIVPVMERVARAQVYCHETPSAIETLRHSDRIKMSLADRAPLWRCRGLAYTLAGKVDAAETDFQRAADADPRRVMSHHNLAGRYEPQKYSAPTWELRTAGKLAAYDALNFAAESMFLGGDALGSMRLYQMALEHQQQLA